jgi:hypothetical protein
LDDNSSLYENSDSFTGLFILELNTVYL